METETYRRHLELGEAFAKLEDWQHAAINYYTAYCEHSSKWEEGPNKEREQLLALSNDYWALHRKNFKVGQIIEMPSGLGGIFEGPCTKIEGDKIFIKIVNPQSSFHGRKGVSDFRKCKVLKNDE